MANRPRRTEAQWRILLSEFEAEDVPAKQFCEARDITYASFSYWRRRCRVAPVETEQAPAFIDLSALTSSQPSSRRWQIELELGDGVVLRLERS